MPSIETPSGVYSETAEHNSIPGASTGSCTTILLLSETASCRSYLDKGLLKEMLQDTSPNARVIDVPKKATPKPAVVESNETPAQKRSRYKQLKKLRRTKQRTAGRHGE